MKLTIITLFAFVAVPLVQARAELKEVNVPLAVQNAVTRNYDLGRSMGDAGGISSLRVFKNEKLTTFQIVYNILADQNSLAGEIGISACRPFGLVECTRKVVERSDEVQANFQFVNLESFIDTMKTWEFEEGDWIQSLVTIERYAQSVLGAGAKSYAYGYDEVADVFTVIMISKDKKTVLIFTGDYGA